MFRVAPGHLELALKLMALAQEVEWSWTLPVGILVVVTLFQRIKSFRCKVFHASWPQCQTTVWSVSKYR